LGWRPRVGSGAMLLVLGVGVNFVLFLALGWVNRLPSRPMLRPVYSAVELFPMPERVREVAPGSALIPEPMTVRREAVEPSPVSFVPTVTSMRRIRSSVRVALPRMPEPVVNLRGIEAVSTAAGSETGALGYEGGGGTDRIDRAPQRVGGSIPGYPYWAQREGLEGSVVLRFVVTEVGDVGAIRVDGQEGDPRFVELAREAVQGWRFMPGRRGNRPVAVWCRQRFVFRVKGGGE